MLTADYEGRRIIVDDLTENEWEALRARSHHRDTTPLRSPITGDPLYCKRMSSTGTRFLALFPGGHDGFTEPETIHHRRLKQLIRDTAVGMGYDCDVEHAHRNADGDIDWIADTIIMRPGRRPLAIEVQWSRQSDERYAERTRRYEGDGVDCVWLDRSSNREPYLRKDWATGDITPVEGALRIPVRQHGDDYETYCPDWVPVVDLVAGILSGRFGAWRCDHILQVFEKPCWKCRRIIASWMREDSAMFPPAGMPRVEEQYADTVARATGIAVCRFDDRYTRTHGGTYRAYVCPYCNAVQGDFYMFNMYDTDMRIPVGDHGPLRFGRLGADGRPAWAGRRENDD